MRQQVLRYSVVADKGGGLPRPLQSARRETRPPADTHQPRSKKQDPEWDPMGTGQLSNTGGRRSRIACRPGATAAAGGSRRVVPAGRQMR